MNETVSFKKIDENLIQQIIKFYKDYEIKNEGNYIVFFAKKKSLSITIYFNKKKEFSVLLNYKNESDYNEFIEKFPLGESKNKKTATARSDKDFSNTQIGSDEVGTGDFFGPIVVVASYIKNTDIDKIKSLGVKDSKLLLDEDIINIGKQLINIVDYSCIVLDNEKYNELYKKNYNINQIKVLLHNKALFNMANKHKDAKRIYVDEFTNRVKYLEYIKNEKEQVRNFFQSTKGESKFISVAVSSIIARYKFILVNEKNSEKYKIKIPFGASSFVDEFAINFAKKYGIKELEKNVKKNFANYNRVISKL